MWKFLLLLNILFGIWIRSSEGVLKCWECETQTGFSPFECDPNNTGHSVECPISSEDSEPVCGVRIVSEYRLKKFCSFIETKEIVSGTTEECDDSENPLQCWCKGNDNCNLEGVLGHGEKGQPCSGSHSIPQQVVVLLVLGLVVFRLGKFRVFIPCLLIGLVAFNSLPGAKGLQCQTCRPKNSFEGSRPDSDHRCSSEGKTVLRSSECKESEPVCYIHMTEYDLDAGNPVPDFEYGCLRYGFHTQRSEKLEGLCFVQQKSDKIDIWCLCNDKDDCNKDHIKGVGLEAPHKDC